MVYDEGFGWPDPYKRERRRRIVRDDPRRVGALLDAIARFPRHHRLIAVFELPEWVAPVWREVDASGFPMPTEEEVLTDE